MNLKQAYSTLGIYPEADLDEVKKVYRKLAMKYHPDVNKDNDATEKFQEINEAYQSIVDKDKNIRNLVSSDFRSLEEYFGFENQKVLKHSIDEYSSEPEVNDVEKFVYLTPEEAKLGKELSVQYMVERFESKMADPIYDFEIVNITIPPHVKDGQVITLKGVGNQVPNGKKSDLNIIIEIE